MKPEPHMKGPGALGAVRAFLRRFDVDRAVLAGILTRVWGMGAGPVTALLIAARFSPECQGYYYTFTSLLALQVFVELGLGTVIIQFASHEWSKLRLEPDGRIVGDGQVISRLGSLGRMAVAWYGIGGIIVAVGLGASGSLFFAAAQPSPVDWFMPWMALCALTGVSICLIPVWALLEGCNQVAVIYPYRFVQGVVASSVIWVAILMGMGLWAAPLSLLAMLICAAAFLGIRYGRFIGTLLRAPLSVGRIRWKEEVFPMQWRIALSWISGYFAFSLFTPVIFHYHGAVAAGQFGMTWSVIGAVSMVAGAWLPPKIPVFGMLIAKKDYVQLDALFYRTVRLFGILTVLAAAGIWVVIYGLNAFGHVLAARLLPLAPTTIFLVAQVVMVLSLPFAAYLRAHKKEPLLYVSLACGVMTAASTLILGRAFSIEVIGLGYLAVNCIVMPVIMVIWLHCRREWHRDGVSLDGVSLRQEYVQRRIREKGLFYCGLKAFQQGVYRLLCVVAGLAAYLPCRLLNVRFIVLSERAIGHLSVELDCYIKEGVLGLRSPYWTVLLAPPGKVANRHLLQYWGKYVSIVSSGVLGMLLDPLAKNKWTGYGTYHFAFSTDGAHYPAVQRQYNGRPPLLELTPEDRLDGKEVLRRLGLPEGAWFVCVHCREDGFLGDVNQSLRNADIGNYHLAMEMITRRGGWVVRMGDPTMKPLAPMDRVVDYAHSPLKSEQMDVFLCASCRFFLGSVSGLYHVASIFGVPSAIANIAHMAGVLPYGPDDIGIPKLVWSEKQGRYLTFAEVLASPAADFLFDDLFMRHGLRPQENTPEEIKALALEMLDRLEGRLVYTVEDEARQEQFKALMTPRHYSYGAVSRVGRDFLEQHASLLAGEGRKKGSEGMGCVCAAEVSPL